MSEQRNLGAELKAQIEADLRKATSLPPSEWETVLAPYIEPVREMFAQLETVRRAWFSWVDENRETLLRVGQVVHEVAGKVGTFLVAMDQASQHFAETLREVERLADYGWTVPTELTVSELIEFLRSPDAEAAAAYLIERLDATDSDWSQMEARLSGDAHLAEFQTVLPQCFRAIRRGDYAIAVPNLMAMLEEDHPDPEPGVVPRVHGCLEDPPGQGGDCRESAGRSLLRRDLAVSAQGRELALGEFAFDHS